MNRSPTVWTTGVQSAAFGSVLMVFAESPCELRFQVCLTSGRCLGARVSDPPLSPVCFFMQLAPHGFFLNWTARGVVFRSACALLIKNRPVRGGFLFSLVLRRPNSKLCRWYRTFFEILLRIPAFLGQSAVQVRFRIWYTATGTRQIAQRGSCQSCERSVVWNGFLRKPGRGRRESLLGLSVDRFR